MYEVNGNRLARLRPILGIVTILCVLSFTALAGTKTASAPKPAAKPAAPEVAKPQVDKKAAKDKKKDEKKPEN